MQSLGELSIAFGSWFGIAQSTALVRGRVLFGMSVSSINYIFFFLPITIEDKQENTDSSSSLG